MALTAQERKGLLLMTGRTVTSIAAELGYSKGMISLVLNGRYRHAGIEASIARMLARPVDEVWEPRPVRAVAGA